MDAILSTNRLYLRKITLEDAPDLFEMDSNPNVHTYLGNNPKKSLDGSIKDVHHIQKQYRENGIGRLAVVLQETDEMIGWSFFKLENTELINGRINFYDIGYRLKEKHWGKGYGFESAKASLDYGFNELGFEKICGFVHVDNAGSKRIFEKLGMQFINSFEFWNEPFDWYEKVRT